MMYLIFFLFIIIMIFVNDLVRNIIKKKTFVKNSLSSLLSTKLQ